MSFLLAMLVAALACGGAGAKAADGFTPVGVSLARADWVTAANALRATFENSPVHDTFAFVARSPRWRRTKPPRAHLYPAFTQLSAATERHFPGVVRAPLPVLAPFDVTAFLADRMRGVPDLDVSHYLNGFSRLIHFSTGPAGYTAVISLDGDNAPNLPKRVYPKPVEIHITGSLVTYDVTDPAGGKGVSVGSLEEKFPGIRRFIREGFVRYAFTLYGVPYVVSVDCLDSTPRRRRLACREAYPIAEKYLAALTIVGGRPSYPRAPAATVVVERPGEQTDGFAFLPAGDIIKGTGYRGYGGASDWTVYAQIRFPIENAPAVVGSQSYRHWGKCARRGRFPLPRAMGRSDRCGDAGETGAPANSVEGAGYIVWRDNFCERRDFEAWQCPGGWGHQGQDIQASACVTDKQNCRAGLDKVVAAREGDILRSAGDEGAYLVVNEPYEHVRFRHMHLDPRKMDADGLVHGRHVREGEVIGEVSNYLDRRAGTSVHLHFDLQVFTREGWIWVNPYATLIASYERLIGARGRLFQTPLLQPVALPLERPGTAPVEGGSAAERADAEGGKAGSAAAP